MSEVIKNRYQITQLIGKGGMAEVYLAWDNILNREVAIKILKADMSDDDLALERFKREAGSITKLSHPNIVDVYDVGEDNGKHFIVMEYVKGYTLKQLIKKRGPIPPKEAVWMMKQLSGALMEAHANDIIHRDIKSQNVLIKPDGTIKLSDFGIALSADAMQITHKDSILGSVHYLAPEISQGRSASMQSDIYSLGIVFYELLTGDVPFKADTPVQVALKHVKETMPYVRDYNRDIPQSVENIVIKACAKSLNERYSNIALMIKDLNECLKPQHANDIRLILNDKNNTNIKFNSNIHIAEENKKNNSFFHRFFLISVSVLAVILIIALLLMSGIFKKDKNIFELPSLKNLTVLEAKDILIKYSLEIDEANIKYELSDNVEKDLIISSSPEAHSQVEKGSKIKLIVSKGIYSKLNNYVGKNYLEAKKDLEEKKFTVRLIPEESDLPAGNVISQSLKEGYEYDPTINNEISLSYSQDNTIILEISKGEDIDDVIIYLNENDIKYEECILDKDEFSEDEILNTKPNTLIKTDPEIGIAYEKSSDIIIKLYYYTKEIEEEISEE